MLLRQPAIPFSTMCCSTCCGPLLLCAVQPADCSRKIGVACGLLSVPSGQPELGREPSLGRRHRLTGLNGPGQQPLLGLIGLKQIPRGAAAADRMPGLGRHGRPHPSSRGVPAARRVPARHAEPKLRRRMPCLAVRVRIRIRVRVAFVFVFVLHSCSCSMSRARVRVHIHVAFYKDLGGREGGVVGMGGSKTKGWERGGDSASKGFLTMPRTPPSDLTDRPTDPLHIPDCSRAYVFSKQHNPHNRIGFRCVEVSNRPMPEHRS